MFKSWLFPEWIFFPRTLATSLLPDFRERLDLLLSPPTALLKFAPGDWSSLRATLFTVLQFTAWFEKFLNQTLALSFGNRLIACRLKFLFELPMTVTMKISDRCVMIPISLVEVYRLFWWFFCFHHQWQLSKVSTLITEESFDMWC
jgi:hypothetical protein